MQLINELIDDLALKNISLGSGLLLRLVEVEPTTLVFFSEHFYTESVQQKYKKT